MVAVLVCLGILVPAFFMVAGGIGRADSDSTSRAVPGATVVRASALRRWFDRRRGR